MKWALHELVRDVNTCPLREDIAINSCSCSPISTNLSHMGSGATLKVVIIPISIHFETLSLPLIL